MFTFHNQLDNFYLKFRWLGQLANSFRDFASCDIELTACVRYLDSTRAPSNKDSGEIIMGVSQSKANITENVRKSQLSHLSSS